MKKIHILFLASGLLLLSGCSIPSGTKEVLEEVACTSTGGTCSLEEELETIIKDTADKTIFDLEETEFDFGTIKQSGGKVNHQFKLTYNGEEPIKITGLPTSCACTSAQIDRSEINPGDTATITVTFNPNLHEEPEGRFFKTVMLLTDPKLPTQPEVRIWAEIDLDLGPQAFELQGQHDDEDEEEKAGLTSYNTVTPVDFDQMLKTKDFILIDVHIPEQQHIQGTDLVIPYNEFERFEDKLPQDKNTKIVLYCRSGSMSRAFAYQLVEHGYTNVYDLIGGKIAYDEYLQK